VVILGVWFLGVPAYKQAKERRAIGQMRRFLADGDLRNASIAAKQALELNPKNLDATVAMAEIAEASRSPQLVDWRQRVVELSPTPDNKLLLASAALRVQYPPYPIAKQVLADLGSATSNNLSYHLVAAELAIRENAPGEAEAHFAEACRIAPTNELHRLNLMALRLQSTNQAVAISAREALNSLKTSTNAGAPALRWLIADSSRLEDLNGALGYSTELLSNKQCGFEDRLRHLNILRKLKADGVMAFLETLKLEASANAAQAHQLATWMLGNGMAEESGTWWLALPEQVRTTHPAPLAYVDFLAVKRDWLGLEAYLEESKWGDKEFMRYALLSQVAFEQKQVRAAETRWATAMREAGDRLTPLLELLSMATKWNRMEAREPILWQILNRFPRERWVISELDQLYSTAGNTRGLNKLYAAVVAREPNLLVARNNLVATSLLLERDLTATHEMARTLYTEQPTNAVIASTYAFSLYRQSRAAEAAEVLEKVDPGLLEKPPLALYKGLVLQAIGQTNGAARYFEVVRASRLLPEERALIPANFAK